jgi:RNA-directed DNA polymerase
VLEGDIKGCFDHISHDWLLTHIPLEKPILRQWLKAGFMEKRVWSPTQAGTPQGGIISPLLANLTLDGLETKLKEQFPPRSQRGRTAQLHLVRYADDFIITGSSREILEQAVKPLVEQFLKERGLELSPDKTKVTHIDTGFDFLGQHLRKFKGKLIIKPSQESVRSLLQKVRHRVKTNPMTPAGRLLAQLNPLLRGWANYHRHVVSQRTFSHIDNQVSQILWRWAKRRHPRKSSHWLKQKYFRAEPGRKWVFHGNLPQPNGPPTLIRLFKTQSIPSQRHLKIKAEANPYDPHWEQYFEQRLDRKMTAKLKGRGTLLYLWRQQKGLCPLCQQKITDLTGWHSHHLVWRSQGGHDGIENLILLHPLCHRQVHSQDLKVGKPRP